MSNKKNQQEKEQQNVNKVKAVRLYKIGGYQPDNDINYEDDYDPRYSAFNSSNIINRRVQFNDPREFYFNPYQFGQYIPPANFSSNYPPMTSDFSYQRKRNNFSPQTSNLRNQYYNWNKFDTPQGHFLNKYNEEDEDDVEEEDENEENDGDDEAATDKNTEEDEDEDEEEEDEDEDDEKLTVKKEPELNLKNQPQITKKLEIIEPKKENVTKQSINQPILKTIIESAPTPPLQQLVPIQIQSVPTPPPPPPPPPPPTIPPQPPQQLQSLPLPPIQSNIQTPKSILVTENKSKLFTDESQIKSPAPIARIMPIKATTKKIVKITTAEVLDAPYKVEKPMSPVSKAKFLRKSSIDSTKSNEDKENNNSLTADDKNKDNSEKQEEIHQEMKDEKPTETSVQDTETKPNLESTKNDINSNVFENDEKTNQESNNFVTKEDDLLLNNDLEPNIISIFKEKEQEKQEEQEEEKEKEVEESNENNPNIYDKSFRMDNIEVLPTIVEVVPLKEETKQIENLPKKETSNNKNQLKKKYEAPKPVIKERKPLTVPVINQSNDNLNKQSFVLAKPRKSDKSEANLVSMPKIDKTVKEIHDFIKENDNMSKLDKETNDEESTNSFDDNLFLKERENSTFFGKIGKLEVPSLVSDTITPTPFDNESDKQQLSDHDLRINEIIEENRIDLFKIQADQLYREEIIEIKSNRKSNLNKSKKNRKKKGISLPNKFSSQYLLERAYSDLKLNKSNLPVLSNMEDKSREFKFKNNDDENRNDLKFPSLILSEKPEEYKSFTYSGAHNLNSRKYLDPGFKRCPCLMHNRLYYEDINNKIAPDIEPYEMRPCSVKDRNNLSLPNYYNSTSDYQLIYGEKYASFFPNRLRSVNEVLSSENNLTPHMGECEMSFHKTNSSQVNNNTDKIYKQREPWNNAF